MAFAAQLRQQIEATLAARTQVRLTLAPRLVRPGSATGYDTLDTVLRGGLPVAGTSEIVGSLSSGRTSIAAAYLAERTREGHLCAWIDVAGDMVPDAALADGVDLDRLLVVRCCGSAEMPAAAQVSERVAGLRTEPEGMHLVAAALPEARPNLRPYNPTRNRMAGTPGAPNRMFVKASERVEQVNSDRAPARRGLLVVNKHAAQPVKKSVDSMAAKRIPFVKAKRPWSRLEQAVKAVDLLVQAGGFGAIVLDLGAIAPRFARRIPLATWFRWRAALERTRTSLVVLSQLGCSGSSAELVLRVEAELPEQGTVLTGISYRLEVVRRRFAESEPQSAMPQRKQPQGATAWRSCVPWAAS